MSLWACISHWTASESFRKDAFPWCFQGPVPYALLRSMLVAFSQLPDSKMLCRSALMSLGALGTSNSTIATQVPSLLLVLYREGPVLPADVWMPLVPLLDHLSQYSPTGSRTRQQAESIGKWKLFNCTAHGPDGSDQHFRTRTYVYWILHASTAPRMQRLQYSPWPTISVCTDWPARPSIWPSLATAMPARQSRNATSTITRSTRLDATFGCRHTIRPIGI